MGRLISAGSICYDQLDFFSPVPPFARMMGAASSDLSVRLFVNNAIVSWPIASGVSVLDSSVASGKVYFSEIPGNPGFYSIRFFPDRVGFWRIVFTHVALGVEEIREYDAFPPGVLRPSTGSLVPSTSRC